MNNKKKEKEWTRELCYNEIYEDVIKLTFYQQKKLP